MTRRTTSAATPRGVMSLENMIVGKEGYASSAGLNLFQRLIGFLADSHKTHVRSQDFAKPLGISVHHRIIFGMGGEHESQKSPKVIERDPPCPMGMPGRLATLL